MKLYQIILNPMAGFGTPLKGDTLFGHFCWQAAYDSSLLKGGLENQLALYHETPFAVFSSAVIEVDGENGRFLVKRPDVPLTFFSQFPENRKDRMIQIKEFKGKSWMIADVQKTLRLRDAELLSDVDVLKKVFSGYPLELMETGSHEETDIIALVNQPHNTINRITNTTGSGRFAPFAIENAFYRPGINLCVFVLVNTAATDIDRILTGLDRIGKWGYGRDASTGMGRFTLGDCEEISFPGDSEANACYTLGPCVPDMRELEKIYYLTFVRYGKHGDRFAVANNPFKNPVIMADEGAVILPRDKKAHLISYVGTAIRGVSKTKPESVVQGYAPCLPVKLEQ